MRDTRYAIRVSPKGSKTFVIRLHSEEEARRIVKLHLDRGTPAKYTGKVVMSRRVRRKYA
jgi:hypothetical protein